MSETRTKLIMCGIRTFGAVAIVWILALLVRYFEINYEDVKMSLGLVNAYLPEGLLLGGIGAGVYVFYKMEHDPKSDFTFDLLFKAGNQYDIYRFGYFWLLIIGCWVIFVAAWRDKPIEGILGIVLGIFVAKSGIDSIANAMGKKREEGASP